MKYEIEVIYLKNGSYDSRKFSDVDEEKSDSAFRATIKKMHADKKEAIISLRLKDGEDYYLLNSIRT